MIYYIVLWTIAEIILLLNVTLKFKLKEIKPYIFTYLLFKKYNCKRFLIKKAGTIYDRRNVMELKNMLL